MKPIRSSKALEARSPKRRIAVTPALVLIVDDDENQREMYSMYLAAKGFRIALAGDGVSAVRCAQSVQPDVIVMDLALPRLDGWEATRRLKQNPLTAHMPILAFTAHVFGAAGERAIDAGCDDYVIKPCLPEQLVRHIRSLLARSVRKRHSDRGARIFPRTGSE